jgi:LuxR family maltose regulon positive regulatory protein
MQKNSVAPAKPSWPKSPDAVPRERLFRSLDELRAHPILWIGGPPGAGKTTLIASYLCARQVSGVRYAVDSEHGDPQRFCRALGLAQNCSTARLDKQRRSSTAAVAASPTALVREFLRDLYHQMPRPAVLVLDDCHSLAHDALLHTLLVDSVVDIPSGVNVILIGRGEPPSAYTRLIANRALAVLDSGELRFTADETSAVAYELSTDKRVLDALHSQCAGWAAGIALAVGRLRRQGTTKQVLEAGTREAAFNYFAGEVFDRADLDERRVLVSTALLPRTSARMAAELTGNPLAQAILNKFASRQLFTIRSAGAPPSYEYEPLFRQFLLTRLEETVSTLELKDIANRASTLLEQSGDLEASAALSSRTENWASLLRLICRHGMRLLAQGNAATVQRWIAAVPSDVHSAEPWLAYWSGAAAISANPLAARARLEAAWTQFEVRADRLGQLLTAASMLETYRFEWSTFESAQSWIDRLEGCLAFDFTFPSREMALSVYANLLCALVWVRPASNLMALCIARLKPLLDSDVDVNHRLFAGRSLLVGYCSRLDVGSSRDVAIRLRSLLGDQGCSPAARVATLNAVAYAQWLECAYLDAEGTLREASTITGEHHLGALDPLYHQMRHLLAFGRGNRAEIGECVQATRQIVESTPHQGMGVLSLAVAELSLLRGDSRAAADHCSVAAAQADRACARPMQWISRLVLSGCRAALGDFADATKVLQQARELMEGVPASGWQRDYELLAAYVALRREDRIACHRWLGSALTAAEYAGAASQVLALLPCAMGELCMEALHAGIAVETVRALIRRYRLCPPASADREWPWPFKVSVLGRFRLLKGDAEIGFSRRIQKKTLELLQALIALGGTEVGAGTLTDALWPDSDGDAGYHALESALYRLRQLLGAPGAVTMAGSKLSLDRNYFWVDMWAFERELQLSATRGSDIAVRLAQIRQLYQGHFLQHESDKPWALKTRQGLRDKFVRSIREIARAYETQCLWEEAASVYQTGLELDGLAEDLYRGLMLCHRELGDHSEAMHVYRRCRELMTRILGVQPNAKTQAIYNSVRQSQIVQIG